VTGFCVVGWQAGPGWTPKAGLVGHEGRVFLLDFFGAPHPPKKGINVSTHYRLTLLPV
jgi:hypothetical protein